MSKKYIFEIAVTIDCDDQLLINDLSEISDGDGGFTGYDLDPEIIGYFGKKLGKWLYDPEGYKMKGITCHDFHLYEADNE